MLKSDTGCCASPLSQVGGLRRGGGLSRTGSCASRRSLRLFHRQSLPRRLELCRKTTDLSMTSGNAESFYNTSPCLKVGIKSRMF